MLHAKRTLFALSALLLGLSAAPAVELVQGTPAPAQDQAESGPFVTVDGTLDALYAAVSFGPGEEVDWERVREILMEGAIFVQPARPGEVRKVMDVEGFFADWREFIASTQVKTTGFNERIAQRTTDTFGDVAHSYVVFEARLDPASERPVARGLDSVQLVRSEGRWWVASITTEFERPQRPLPGRFLGREEE